MIDKYELKQKMQNGVVTVVFEKLDGSTRVLKGTLLTEYLPDDYKHEDFISIRQPSEETLSVIDTETGQWRSFRLDSIKELIVG